MPPRKRSTRKKATGGRKRVTRSSTAKSKAKKSEEPVVSKEEVEKETNEGEVQADSPPTDAQDDLPSKLPTDEHASVPSVLDQQATAAPVLVADQQVTLPAPPPDPSTEQTSNDDHAKTIIPKVEETPTKKRRIDQGSPSKDLTNNHKLPTDSAISQLFQRRDLRGLTLISQSLVRKSEKTFLEYKKITDKRAKTAETLISNLTKENAALKNTVKELKSEVRPSKESEQLKRRIENMKKAEAAAASELAKLVKEKKTVDTQLEEAVKELDLYDSKQEIVELLSGASCVGYEENQKSLTFRMKQIGDGCILFYELILSQNAAQEIVYMPLLERPAEWDEDEVLDWQTNTENLQRVLPDYLLDSLTFPSSTLRNFYSKIARSIGKNSVN
ncbi:DEKNAAC101715 [Brettanomyces naardenensis]|uniref:DEKNAAC101715 n=1 Tax=Brettanomyces naardenensis TaxID=13370 RepID=A0A448YIM6_BRENA|nr:DEKNAAC101715 [Brettanomyces naardenensis]